MKTLEKIKFLAVIILLFITAYSCKETLDPSPIRKGEAPASVSDYTVEPLAGGAKITYKLPEGTDLRYVKADYELKDGVKYEAKSSLYKNYVVLEGFNQPGEYNVTITAVGVGEVESAPVTIKINVLTPPYLATINGIKESANMYATFGGININYKNTSEGNIVVHVLVKDSSGQWKEAENIYTRSLEGTIKLRGYEPVTQEFGVFVTDRWNNKSDTVSYSLTPKAEYLMDKSLFKEFTLPTDRAEPSPGASAARRIFCLWNDDIDGVTTRFQTSAGTGMPQSFTFDMGVKSQLSRFTVWANASRSQDPIDQFTGGHPREFELYGSNSPNPDGSWDSWTLLGKFNSVKPSGLPVGTNTAEDNQVRVDGENYDVDSNNQAYRYYRWKTLATWGLSDYIWLSELSFYGLVQ